MDSTGHGERQSKKPQKKLKRAMCPHGRHRAGTIIALNQYNSRTTVLSRTKHFQVFFKPCCPHSLCLKIPALPGTVAPAEYLILSKEEMHETRQKHDYIRGQDPLELIIFTILALAFFITACEDDSPSTGGETPALLFEAADAEHGRELWFTDSTEMRTLMAKDINTSGDSSPYEISPINGKVGLKANIGTDGSELWVSDSTAGDTLNFKPLANAFCAGWSIL